MAHKHYTARGRLTKRIELMLVGLTFNTLCLFVRCVNLSLTFVVHRSLTLYSRALYRTVELAEGWGGRILRTEIYFSESRLSIIRNYSFVHLHLLAGRLARRRDDRVGTLDLQYFSSGVASCVERKGNRGRRWNSICHVGSQPKSPEF